MSRFRQGQAVEVQIHPSAEWTPALYDAPSPLGRRHVVFPRGHLVAVRVPDRRIRAIGTATGRQAPKGSA